MLHIIKTQTTFENIYLIEADSEAEARSAVMDDDIPPDFVQKHLGERVTDVTRSVDATADIITRLKKEGYR